MTEEAIIIKLSSALDLTIFSGRPIHLHFDDKVKSEIEATVIDRDNNQIAIQPFASGDIAHTAKLAKKHKATAFCNYKSMLLTFDCSLVSYNEKMNTLVFSIPSKGTLIERRKSNRKKFDKNTSNLSAELTIETLLGTIHVTTCDLIDYSFDIMTFRVSRDQGLILVDDNVSKIKILNHQSVLFDGCGKVIRTTKPTKAHNDFELYEFVVELENNSKPNNIVDISKKQRKSDRYSLINDDSAFVEFEHPFKHGSNLSGKIIDIGSSGLSLFIENVALPIPNGLILRNTRVQLPRKPSFNITLKVTNIQNNHSDQNQLIRIGFEFENLGLNHLKDISKFVQKHISSHLVDAGLDDYDRLWEFFFETEFIYNGKRKQIQQYASKIFDTYDKMLKSNTPILKKILYKEGDDIRGHVNAVKIFDHTHIIQHLSALKAQNGSAAAAVIAGILDYLLDEKANASTSNRFACSYFRPNNLYPSLVFGGTEEVINDPKVCWTRTYRFCLKTNEPQITTKPYIKYYEASDLDLGKLEATLIEQNEYALIKLESLSRESLVNLDISEEFEKIGLYRYRKVFVARNTENQETVYAVCNYTSPGINLSELTNSVKFYYSNPMSDCNQDLVNTLINPILESYKSTDMPDCILLLDKHQPIPDGFESSKSYTLWVFDTLHTERIRNSILEIARNLKEIIKKRKLDRPEIKRNVS